MLSNYIKAALKHAKYEILEEDGSFYGEIPECNGVYAQSDSLEDCRAEIEEVLEEWILFRIYKNLELPVIDGREIIIKELA
ncbi:MAG: type II toxin-antitoxin system HicB family antitoxin [Bacteroidales bacterium]|nr:type II toxin-antitoxin system HicB family antitoxin [Bacteroidales bacterium]